MKDFYEMTTVRQGIRFAVSAVLCAAVANTAYAQESGPVLEEIVITAQKRAENLQNTALAVTALTADSLSDRRILALDDVATIVPNMSFGQSVGAARIAIRGIGFDNIPPGAEGRVAYHVDGVYVGRPAATMSSFFDVERIEVLRGPQGTLYGRNATGGSINLITKGPSDEIDGYIRTTIGNYDHVGVEAAIGGPLSNIISGRIAVSTVDHTGYGENLFTGHDIDNAHARSYRAELKIAPSDAFSATISVARHNEDDQNYSYKYLGLGNLSVPVLGVALGGSTSPDPRNVNATYDPQNQRVYRDSTLTMSWKFAEGLSLRSITSYSKGDRFSSMDLDATELPITKYFHRENSNQFSQELQFIGERGKFRWVNGLYYYTEKVDAGTYINPWSLALFGFPLELQRQGYFAGGSIDTDALAAFGELNYQFTDKLSVLVGARYSWEKKKLHDMLQLDVERLYSPDNPIIPIIDVRDSDSWTAFTPKASIQYQFSHSSQAYAMISRGFKSGGYNPGGGGAPSFRPELLWNYEVGLKADWFGGRMRTNLAAFFYDYKDIQVTKVVSVVAVIDNAASATVKGLEAEVTILPTDRVQVDFSGALLKATYDKFSTENPAIKTNPPTVFNLNGHPLPQAPNYTARLGLQYTLPTSIGEFKLRGEGYWVDDVYFTAYKDKLAYQPAHSTYNAFLNFESTSGTWSGTVFMKNIENKTIANSAFVSSDLLGYPVLGGVDPPRTFGVSLGYKFR